MALKKNVIHLCENPDCCKAFLTAQSLLNKGRGKYCSVACSGHMAGGKYNDAAKMRAGITPESRKKQSQSQRTTPKWGHKTAMICDGCGQTFVEYPSKRPKPLKFCTRACGLAWQQRTGNGSRIETADTEPIHKPRKAKPGEQIVYINDAQGKRLENR